LEVADQSAVTDRLFDIIQVLRLARTPLTAAAIASELEVTPRTDSAAVRIPHAGGSNGSKPPGGERAPDHSASTARH
jgi:hypothetical protein